MKNRFLLRNSDKPDRQDAPGRKNPEAPRSPDGLPERTGGERPKLSREEALFRRVESAVEAHPGIAQHEVARRLGDKPILVLSVIDQMVNRGRLTRQERGELYLPQSAPEQAGAELDPAELAAALRAESTLFWARTVWMFHQMVRRTPSVTVETSRQALRMFYMREKLLSVRRYSGEPRCEIAVYGSFREAEARQLLERLEVPETRIAAGGDLVTFICRGSEEVGALRPVLVRLVEYVGHRHFVQSEREDR